MGCGTSSLTGDSFEHISAKKPSRFNIHAMPSTSQHPDSTFASSARARTSSDPTKGPYLPPQREEPLRDTALETTGHAHHRKQSYHNKGEYRDLTMPNNNDDNQTYPAKVGAGHRSDRKRLF
jgi:hypothetical protein